MRGKTKVPMNTNRSMGMFALFFAFIGTVLMAQEKPEAILAAAKKLSDNQPWQVEAHVVAKEIDMNISGIINGKDFDLTIDAGDQVRRQIVIGDKGWLTEKDGKTWKSWDANDRRFYYLVHTAIAESDQKIPPLEKVGIERKGRAVSAVAKVMGEDSLLHIRFKAAQKINYEGDRPNWWILLKDGEPDTIRHYHGPAGFEGNLVVAKVDYTPVTEPNPVIPPPGNPRVAEGIPKILLIAAMKKMREGVWGVNGTAAREKTIRIHGLVSGEDFDLTMEFEDGGVMRQIALGDKAWAKPTGDKPWKKAQPNDRLVYNLADAPIAPAPWAPAFEKVGEEPHNGATWLHIRGRTKGNTDANELSQYWLALDAQGQPLYIARYEGVISSLNFNKSAATVTNTTTRCQFEYKPAKDKRIAPPEGSRKTKR
jgi:hypothetical protein